MIARYAEPDPLLYLPAWTNVRAEFPHRIVLNAPVSDRIRKLSDPLRRSLGRETEVRLVDGGFAVAGEITQWIMIGPVIYVRDVETIAFIMLLIDASVIREVQEDWVS